MKGHFLNNEMTLLHLSDSTLQAICYVQHTSQFNEHDLMKTINHFDANGIYHEFCKNILLHVYKGGSVLKHLCFSLHKLYWFMQHKHFKFHFK